MLLSQVKEKVYSDDVGEVASNLLSKPRGSLHIEPDICLRCGSRCDVENSHAEVNKAWNHLRRCLGFYVKLQVNN